MINKRRIQLLQPRCYLCDLPIDNNGPFLCQLCQQELPYTQSSVCRCCGQPYLNIFTPSCNECRMHIHPWQQLIACMNYTLECKYLIKQLKFSNQPQLSILFGRLLSRIIAAELIQGKLLRPEALVSIPLHKKRQASRGYNQAHLIAKEVAKQLQIPLLPAHQLIRPKHTLAQSQQDKTMRKANMQAAFQLGLPLNINHVALIDDVVTTMETIKAASQTLAASGVQLIDIWCVARTLTD